MSNGIITDVPRATLPLDSLLSVDEGKKSVSQQQSIPPVAEEALKELLKKLSLPALSAPTGKGLSLDTLISAIGNEVRKQACKDGVDSLKVKGERQKEVNDEQLSKLKDQIEEMERKKVLDGFLKAFKIIGVIIGVIASSVSIAAGVATGNPLLIAAGIAGMVASIDSIVSLASDGKYSMMVGFTELGKAMGMDDKAAGIFGMAVQIYFTITTIGMSIGAGLGNAAGSIAKISEEASKKALDAIIISQKIMNFASAGLNMAQGSATIAGAVISYNMEMFKVSAKELDAILERLRQSMEMDRELIESEMQRANDLMSMVKDIVDNVNETQTAILTVPQMA